jgi:O-6-methylguanine DNA methyltransferase
MPTSLAIKFCRLETPTGLMLAVTDDHERLRAMDRQEHEARLRTLLERGLRLNAVVLRKNKAQGPVVAKIAAYSAGDVQALDGIATEVIGTAVQRKVWDAICIIPPGETRSYSQVANMIGKPNAFRAVASAISLNPVASDGKLGGCSGGTQRKEWLLGFERQRTRFPR